MKKQFNMQLNFTLLWQTPGDLLPVLLLFCDTSRSYLKVPYTCAMCCDKCIQRPFVLLCYCYSWFNILPCIAQINYIFLLNESVDHSCLMYVCETEVWRVSLNEVDTYLAALSGTKWHCTKWTKVVQNMVWSSKTCRRPFSPEKRVLRYVLASRRQQRAAGRQPMTIRETGNASLPTWSSFRRREMTFPALTQRLRSRKVLRSAKIYYNRLF